jgi:hypothetical protein
VVTPLRAIADTTLPPSIPWAASIGLGGGHRQVKEELRIRGDELQHVARALDIAGSERHRDGREELQRLAAAVDFVTHQQRLADGLEVDAAGSLHCTLQRRRQHLLDPAQTLDDPVRSRRSAAPCQCPRSCWCTRCCHASRS